MKFLIKVSQSVWVMMVIPNMGRAKWEAEQGRFFGLLSIWYQVRKFMHICEIKILIIVRWDRNFKVLVGFVSNESSGTRKSQTTSDIHSMLVNHLYAFFTFRKTGRVKLQGFTDLLAPIKTDSNHSWTLLCLCSRNSRTSKSSKNLLQLMNQNLS